LDGGIEETHAKCDKMAYFRIDIRNWDLQNTKQDCQSLYQNVSFVGVRYPTSSAIRGKMRLKMNSFNTARRGLGHVALLHSYRWDFSVHPVTLQRNTNVAHRPLIAGNITYTYSRERRSG